MNADPTATGTFKVTEAKAKLSELMARAESGDEVFIARGNAPVIQLVPVRPPKRARPGRLAHWATHDDSALFEVDPDQSAIDAGDWTDPVGIWQRRPSIDGSAS
jgi:prevent-host-death family protein